MDSFWEMDLFDKDDVEICVFDLFRGDFVELDENVYVWFWLEIMVVIFWFILLLMLFDLLLMWLILLLLLVLDVIFVFFVGSIIFVKFDFWL